VIRQSVDSEMVCLRATGTSLWFYSLPILLFGLIATGFNLVNTVMVAPNLYHRYAELEARIIKAHADEKLLPGKFNFDFGNKAIQVGARSADNELFDIFIADEEFTRASSAILASRGRIEVDAASEQVFFRLRDGAIYAAAANDPQTFRTVDFAKLDYRLEFKSKGSVSSSVVKRDSTANIWKRLQTEDPADPLYSRWEVEFYTRMTFPWSCLVFALAALPMAIVDPRAGRSGSFMRAVFLVLAYYIIWIAFKDLVRGGSAPSGVLWLPLLLIGFFGLFRLWQTNSDVRLLSLVWRR